MPNWTFLNTLTQEDFHAYLGSKHIYLGVTPLDSRPSKHAYKLVLESGTFARAYMKKKFTTDIGSGSLGIFTQKQISLCLHKTNCVTVGGR